MKTKKSGVKKLKILKTQERMEEAIIKLKDVLVLSGKTLHEAEDDLIQSKGVYETFRKVAADKAELDLREAFARLQNGGLFIMSMEMKSVRKICEDLGFQPPKHKGEIDAIYIFAEGDDLRVKLCEVKRPCSFPWHAALRIGRIGVNCTNTYPEKRRDTIPQQFIHQFYL